MASVPIDLDLEMVVLSALRYSLSRSSYSAQSVADFIVKNWDNFSHACKTNIMEDITTYYGESYGDREPWLQIVALKIDDKKSPTN